MEQDFLQEIERISKKEIFELVPEEINFLKARRSYLTPEQLTKFKEILDENEIKKSNKKSK